MTKAAAKATQAFETRLATLAATAEQIKHDLDATRARIQRDREEMDIEYSLDSGSAYVIESPDTGDLREQERAFTQQTIRAAALQRQLTEFTTLISVSSRQLGSEGDFPGLDAQTQAAIRSAGVEAQETERHRLAREIHDGPAQALANAIIALEFVERAIRAGGEGSTVRAQEEVERIKSTLREGLTEIRRFIFDLRPTMLQDRGLVATVEHYIATYQSLFPMAIDFRAADALSRLTGDQELTAFRVIQESIQNARKHARAARVVIGVHKERAALIVTIEDNGRGFSPERVTTHMMGGAGIRGMHERAALVGGEITIDSAPGEGTRIALSLPLSGGDSAPPQFDDEGA
ncbi:MAG: sensor histidine kinase [Chloroflexota bacterium]|nr:sensor histidine kinase [Chloroflexota bacterium]